MSKKDEPVFPGIEDHSYHNKSGYHEHKIQRAGITKREYLAALAMQACLEGRNVFTDVEEIKKAVADIAVRYADALIEELENE